tara:strand:+ start:1192 stop:1746 length:555 start_codon:yes stop_codon:yes gene_type:complete
MFNLSTQEVVSSIENSPLVNLNGILYQEYNNFFPKIMIEKLKNLQNLNWVQLERQEDKPRSKVDDTDLIIKTLKIFFMKSEITKTLENKFETNLSFDSVDIWQDRAGYFLPIHTDDPRVKLALQIYLGDENIGTSLFDEKDTCIKTFEFKCNSGYALLNNKKSRHGTGGKVTDGKRNSLYVRYR